MTRSQKIISASLRLTQGYTLLSLGKGDRESHSWHPTCQEILLALPSKHIQNQITYATSSATTVGQGTLASHLTIHQLPSSPVCMLLSTTTPEPILNTGIAMLNLLKLKSTKFRLWRTPSGGSYLTLTLPFQHSSHLPGAPAQIPTGLVPFIPHMSPSRMTLVLAILPKAHPSSCCL